MPARVPGTARTVWPGVVNSNPGEVRNAFRRHFCIYNRTLGGNINTIRRFGPKRSTVMFNRYYNTVKTTSRYRNRPDWFFFFVSFYIFHRHFPITSIENDSGTDGRAGLEEEACEYLEQENSLTTPAASRLRGLRVHACRMAVACTVYINNYSRRPARNAVGRQSRTAIGRARRSGYGGGGGGPKKQAVPEPARAPRRSSSAAAAATAAAARHHRRCSARRPNPWD